MQTTANTQLFTAFDSDTRFDVLLLIWWWQVLKRDIKTAVSIKRVQYRVPFTVWECHYFVISSLFTDYYQDVLDNLNLWDL